MKYVYKVNLFIFFYKWMQTVKNSMCCNYSEITNTLSLRCLSLFKQQVKLLYNFLYFFIIIIILCY